MGLFFHLNGLFFVILRYIKINLFMTTSTFSDIKLVFDLTQALPSATLRDDTDYSSFADSTDLNGLFTLVGPLGDVLYQNTDSGNPDVETGVNETGSFNLDLTTDGEVINGAYVITFDFTVNATEYTYTKTINYTTCEISGCIIFDSNCDTGTLEATDGTDYESTGAASYEVTRAWELTPPNSDLGLTMETSTEDSVTASPISTKTWSAKLTSDFTLTFSNGLIIINQSVFYSEYEVLCNSGSICDAYECIKAAYDKWNDLKKDSPAKAAEYYEDTLAPLLTMKAMYDTAIACGDSETASEILIDIQGVIDCDCGCSDTDKPVLIGNGSAASEHNLDGDYNGVDVDCGATNLATSGDSMDEILGKVCGLFSSMSLFTVEVNQDTGGVGYDFAISGTTGSGQTGDSGVYIDRIGCDEDIVVNLITTDPITMEGYGSGLGTTFTIPSSVVLIGVFEMEFTIGLGVGTYLFDLTFTACGFTRTLTGQLTVNP
jgi:hypothetical protein